MGLVAGLSGLQSAFLRFSVSFSRFQDGSSSSRHHVLIGKCLKAGNQRGGVFLTHLSLPNEENLSQNPTGPSLEHTGHTLEHMGYPELQRRLKISIWHLQILRQSPEAANRKGNWVWLLGRQPTPSVTETIKEPKTINMEIKTPSPKFSLLLDQGRNKLRLL